jgi:hypothetical protein
MVEKIEEILKLSGSDEALWNEDGRWNFEILEKILEEASFKDLKNSQKIFVSYLKCDDNHNLVLDNKYKTFKDLKDNYFLWNDREYEYNPKVVQNI